MSSVRFHLFLLALAFLFLLSGCITPAQASRCSGFSNLADRNGCYNHFAVWDQEPYLCYSISDSFLRESCLEDSNDPVAQQRLIEAQSNPALQRLPTPAPTPAPKPNTAIAPPAGSTAALIADCITAQKLDADTCMRQAAIQTSNMTLCSQISAGDSRATCISNVALATKNPSLCSGLSRDVDKQVCIHYSSGG